MARSSPPLLTALKSPRFRIPWGWAWPVFWGSLMVGSGVVGIWALAWLTRIPPLPDCQEINRFSSDSERLICAETQMQSASAQELANAIELTAGWPEDHPLYKDAFPILTTASQRLLEKATQATHQGDLTVAVQWAQQIPLETPLRQNAQTAIWNWQQEWKAGAAIAAGVEQQITARNWAVATQTLQDLKTLDSDYWLSIRFGELQQAITREQRAWSQIEQARALAATADPEALGEALLLAQQVDLNSDAWREAKTEIDRWSHNLLLHSFQRWEVGDIDGAVAAVQKVPPDPNLAPEAQDLIRFSHGQQLAQKAASFQPTYWHLFYLMEAIQAAASISPNSSFYEAAQVSMAEWQAELADAQTLQFAHTVSGFRQAWSFNYATRIAEAIAMERPRRGQAQTLIAQWRDQIEHIEDRPYVLRARRLAQKGTIAALQQAIGEAQQVALGRALRIEAQTLIAGWFDQIEVIEDQPLLNEANALASDGKLKGAIAAAEQVQPGRALYDQAQTLIKDWTQTIQIAEDRPILDKATARAYAGALTEAIGIASQIAPGRALYNEARNVIAIWEAERDYIWSLESEETHQGQEHEGASAEGASAEGPSADANGSTTSPTEEPGDSP